MINAAVFIKQPLMYKKGVLIYPPSVKEVVSHPFYSQFVKLLTISQEDIEEDLQKQDSQSQAPTPFEFLLINSYNNKQFEAVAKLAFEFFLHQKVNFIYENKLLIIGNFEQEVQHIKSTEGLITITEEEYFAFQNAIREVAGIPTIKPPEPPNPDEDPRITEIKARARKRDRIKAKQNSKNGISLSTSLVAICCMGIGITPLNIGEMSYASVGPIMAMMQDKEKYDVDIRSLLAGADSKKIKPKYWIRNSDKEE